MSVCMHHYYTSHRGRKLIYSGSFLQGAHRPVKNIYKQVENNCNMMKNKGLKLERCLKYYVRFLVKVDDLYQSGPVTKSDYKSQKEHKNDQSDDVRDLPRERGLEGPRY